MKRILLFLITVQLLLHKDASAQCSAAFQYSITNNTVVFTPAQSDTGMHFWEFGDGNTSAIARPEHVYNSPGNYQVKHLIIDTLRNCKDSIILSVQLGVTPSCNVDFVYAEGNWYNQSYRFVVSTITAATQVKKVTWLINNTVVAEGTSMVYQFPAAGVYNVCARMQTIPGCEAEICKQIQVQLFDSCIIGTPGFTTQTDSINRRKKYFYPSPDNASYLYRWEFGDGSISTDRYASHVYAGEGSYPVKLFVAVKNNNDSCSNVAYDTVYTDSLKSNCSISLTATRISANRYAFSYYTASYIASTKWTVDGENAGTDYFLNYIFSKPGLHRVCVSVETAAGCIVTDCKDVVVDSNSCLLSGANFESSVVSYTPGLVMFSPGTDSAGYTYEWSFGDGTTSGLYKPSHKYATNGVYTVILTISGSADTCKIRVSKMVSVWNIYTCTTSFTANKFTANSMQKHTYKMEVTPADSATSYRWSIRSVDSTGYNTYYGQPLNFNFSDTGYYEVCLETSFVNGCTATNCQWIYVANDSVANSDSGNIVMAYPNPAVSTVTYKLALLQPAMVSIKIYNSQGLPKKQIKYEALSGDNNIKIDIQELPPGLYFSELIFGNNRRTARFQKR